MGQDGTQGLIPQMGEITQGGYLLHRLVWVQQATFWCFSNEMSKKIDKLQTEMILAYLAKKRKPVTPDLQRYYEDRFSMMGTDGWKDLIDDIDNMINSLNNISTIPDEKSLQFKKGELSILTWLKTLKQVSTQAYEELNEKNL